ncbi:Y-family DNA polymerase [Aquabacterium soli]|uniref:Y-family DNA polymerase n=1 Tax=Aquabacterium soli TaxID=2493092 RepID=A0A426V2R9_9BURK|nr:Y-family DNA polymerase [Aquabacterium soli]RRS01204.1 Y-family DNA polymerase [Aquabacterium soli]
MIALCDGNNFFAGVETVFRPSLAGRPVVVLSNNDGCAIARSEAAKALGIKMGDPWFKIKHLEEHAGLVALSANFALYGDMSDRMMTVMAGLGFSQLVYSIDESFIDMTGIRGDLVARAHKVRSRVLQWVGIPCCIGMGQTKTLAKLANHIAKTAERKPGSFPPHLAQVCNLASLTPAELRAIFTRTPVGEVWGVGPKISEQLAAGGINTVQDLVQLDVPTVRARWGVTLERTVRELRGQSCIELDDMASPRQEIACTRSFGQTVSELRPLIEAVSSYASTAGEKLRKQQGLAGAVRVFAHTSPFRPGPRYARSMVVPLRRPTADTSELVTAAVKGLQAIYEPGHQIAKAGVMLLDLIQADKLLQGELNLEPEERPDRTRLMTAVDAVNNRYGKGCVHVATTGSTGRPSEWSMKQERLTPQYTTRWADMPIVRA